MMRDTMTVDRVIARMPKGKCPGCGEIVPTQTATWMGNPFTIIGTHNVATQDYGLMICPGSNLIPEVSK